MELFREGREGVEKSRRHGEHHFMHGAVLMTVSWPKHSVILSDIMKHDVT